MNTSNENLLRILSDTVKTNLTTEDKISRRLVTLVSEGQRRGGNDRASPTANAAHSATADRAGSASSSFHASQGGATSMHGGGKVVIKQFLQGNTEICCLATHEWGDRETGSMTASPASAAHRLMCV